MMAGTAIRVGASLTDRDDNSLSPVGRTARTHRRASPSLLHESALCTASTTPAKNPIPPSSDQETNNSSMSTPTGTKLAVTTTCDSPAGGEDNKQDLLEAESSAGNKSTNKNKPQGDNTLTPTNSQANPLEIEKEIALSQLQELEVAIKVRKVSKVDGRKIRWIEYRARKAEEEKNKVGEKPKRRSRKSKTNENCENEVHVNNNNNNNNININKSSKDTNTMKAEVIGTSNVLESMKLQFLQGTENIDGPVANGNNDVLKSSDTVQKRKSIRTRRSQGTPKENQDVKNAQKSTPKSASKGRSKSAGVESNEEKSENTLKKSASKEVLNGSSEILCKIENRSMEDTTTSITLAQAASPNKVSTPATSPNTEIPPPTSRPYFKSLTKGLREVRKSENGSDVESLIKTENGVLSSIVDPDVKANIAVVSTHHTSSPPLLLTPSPRAKSADTVSAGKKRSVTPKKSKKAVSKSVERTNFETGNLVNGHSVVESSSPGEKEPTLKEDTPAEMEEVSQDINGAGMRRSRGRPPKRKLNLLHVDESKIPTPTQGKSSKKVETIVVDVHNTMNGEPQTVIPVSKPMLRGKKVAPKKKTKKETTKKPSAIVELLDKNAHEIPDQESPSKESEGRGRSKSKSKAGAKERKTSVSKKKASKLSQQGGDEVIETTSASVSNQIQVTPKSKSTKPAKGVITKVPSSSNPTEDMPSTVPPSLHTNAEVNISDGEPIKGKQLDKGEKSLAGRVIRRAEAGRILENVQKVKKSPAQKGSPSVKESSSSKSSPGGKGNSVHKTTALQKGSNVYKSKSLEKLEMSFRNEAESELLEMQRGKSKAAKALQALSPRLLKQTSRVSEIFGIKSLEALESNKKNQDVSLVFMGRSKTSPSIMVTPDKGKQPASMDEPANEEVENYKMEVQTPKRNQKGKPRTPRSKEETTVSVEKEEKSQEVDAGIIKPIDVGSSFKRSQKKGASAEKSKASPKKRLEQKYPSTNCSEQSLTPESRLLDMEDKSASEVDIVTEVNKSQKVSDNSSLKDQRDKGKQIDLRSKKIPKENVAVTLRKGQKTAENEIEKEKQKEEPLVTEKPKKIPKEHVAVTLRKGQKTAENEIEKEKQNEEPLVTEKPKKISKENVAVTLKKGQKAVENEIEKEKQNEEPLVTERPKKIPKETVAVMLRKGQKAAENEIEKEKQNEEPPVTERLKKIPKENVAVMLRKGQKAAENEIEREKQNEEQPVTERPKKIPKENVAVALRKGQKALENEIEKEKQNEEPPVTERPKNIPKENVAVALRKGQKAPENEIEKEKQNEEPPVTERPKKIQKENVAVALRKGQKAPENEIEKEKQNEEPYVTEVTDKLNKAQTSDIEVLGVGENIVSMKTKPTKLEESCVLDESISDMISKVQSNGTQVDGSNLKEILTGDKELSKIHSDEADKQAQVSEEVQKVEFQIVEKISNDVFGNDSKELVSTKLTHIESSSGEVTVSLLRTNKRQRDIEQVESSQTVKLDSGVKHQDLKKQKSTEVQMPMKSQKEMDITKVQDQLESVQKDAHESEVTSKQKSNRDKEMEVSAVSEVVLEKSVEDEARNQVDSARETVDEIQTEEKINGDASRAICLNQNKVDLIDKGLEVVSKQGPNNQELLGNEPQVGSLNQTSDVIEKDEKSTSQEDVYDINKEQDVLLNTPRLFYGKGGFKRRHEPIARPVSEEPVTEERTEKLMEEGDEEKTAELENNNKTLQDVLSMVDSSSVLEQLSEAQGSSAGGKSKEKVPRILKQLLQDEGVQNMLKSMSDETATVPEGSPNDASIHKLRPKRPTEPMLSSSPELDGVVDALFSTSKKRKRWSELDTLYMDEGVLNLLTSLDPHSRRAGQDDAASDISQASSIKSGKTNKSSKSSLDLSLESRKRKLSGTSTVSNTSSKSMQPPESKRICLEASNEVQDPYAYDASEETEPQVVSEVIGLQGVEMTNLSLQRKKGRPALPLSVKQKNKAIRLQLKIQKQKQMKSASIDASQPRDDDNMNLATLQEVLRKENIQAEEEENITLGELQGVLRKENEALPRSTEPQVVEKPSDKIIPPLKIKLASDSVTISHITKPSLNQQSSHVSSSPKPQLQSQPQLQPKPKPKPQPQLQPRQHASGTNVQITNLREPVRASTSTASMYSHSVGPHRRMDSLATPTTSGFQSLVRNYDLGGQGRGRPRMGETLRQSQRASVRQSEANHHYRDISLRKFNNFTQIIMSPSTTKMKNSLNSRVLRELCEALNILKRDASVRMVLLTATGPTFCQGVDLTALQHPNLDTRKKNAENLVRGIKDFLKTLVQFPKPIVAGVNGNAMGLGVTMLPLFDLVIANDKAEFYLPYAKLGQVPEGGATYTFPNLFGKLQSTRLFLGHKVTATKAQEIGLASESIWPATYQQELIPKVALLATQSAQSMEATKALMNHHLITKLELTLESECRVLLQQWTSPHFAHLCKRFLDSHHIHLQKPVNLPL